MGRRGVLGGAVGWAWGLIGSLACLESPAVVGAQERESEAVNLLFIHHSCGGQLLADPGPEVGGDRESGRRCIYDSHPNGGGLRALLQEAGFAVNEASYGSLIGEDTDIRHWPAKFRDHLDRILRTRSQDELLPEGQQNRVVVFKSCFPNNAFTGDGTEPGDAEGPELTVANAKAAYRALLPRFASQPKTLFVAVTAPPLAEPRPRGIRDRLARLLGRRPRSAELALGFNDWLADRRQGWLADYTLDNVVVFDYYDILTGEGRGGWSAYPTGDGRDSHPSRMGNRLAAERFVPFLQEAVDRLEGGGG